MWDSPYLGLATVDISVVSRFIRATAIGRRCIIGQPVDIIMRRFATTVAGTTGAKGSEDFPEAGQRHSVLRGEVGINHPASRYVYPQRER